MRFLMTLLDSYEVYKTLKKNINIKHKSSQPLRRKLAEVEDVVRNE